MAICSSRRYKVFLFIFLFKQIAFSGIKKNFKVHVSIKM